MKVSVQLVIRKTVTVPFAWLVKLQLCFNVRIFFTLSEGYVSPIFLT
jgi:hypothetical protein